MANKSDHLELAYYSVSAFGNNGKLDEHELDKLLEIALRDGHVDENETRILSNIFSKLRAYEISATMRRKVSEVEEKYGISII